MGYVEQNLMPGENITYKAKLHWATFLRPSLGLLLGFLFLLLGATSQDSSTVNGIVCLGGLIFIAAILALISALVTYITTEFAITNKRIIAKTGIIRRRSLEILLTKVESIGVSQPILGRILDYGTIIVTGTGGTKEPFMNIAAPMELRKRVNAQIADSSS